MKSAQVISKSCVKEVPSNDLSLGLAYSPEEPMWLRHLAQSNYSLQLLQLTSLHFLIHFPTVEGISPQLILSDAQNHWEHFKRAD